MAPRKHIEDKIRDMLMDLKNKEMEAILPVNKEGFMHTGTVQAVLYAILTGKVYTGKVLKI